MENILPEIDTQTKELSELLQEHKGQDVTLLDLRKFQTWTDYFIIATVSSKTHADGLERHIKEFCRHRDIDILGISGKKQDDQWRLFDLSSPCFGSIIIHLMSKDIREFYELERLWTPITERRH